MKEILISSSWSLFFLFLWFETNVFYEYLKFLPIFRTYEEKKSLYENPRYSEFLAIHHSNFFSKLVSCPYCLGFWTSVISCLTFCSLIDLPSVYFISLLSYFLVQKLLSLLKD